MNLGADEVVPSDDGSDRAAVIGGRDHVGRIGGRQRIGMHEIGVQPVRPGRNAVEQRVRPELLERFRFDCEAGMFCAYGTDRSALGEVASTLESLLQRPVLLVEALEVAAEHDLFD